MLTSNNLEALPGTTSFGGEAGKGVRALRFDAANRNAEGRHGLTCCLRSCMQKLRAHQIEVDFSLPCDNFVDTIGRSIPIEYCIVDNLGHHHLLVHCATKHNVFSTSAADCARYGLQLEHKIYERSVTDKQPQASALPSLPESSPKSSSPTNEHSCPGSTSL